jgi:hypothetical protein
MGPVGIEPTRVFSPEDFKSPASACSATAPCVYSTHKPNLVKDKFVILEQSDSGQAWLATDPCVTPNFVIQLDSIGRGDK